MINEKLIVSALSESYKHKIQLKQCYECSTNKDDKEIYRNAYLKALDLFSARYQMLLMFGYDVVSDENDNIIGLKSILGDDIPF